MAATTAVHVLTVLLLAVALPVLARKTACLILRVLAVRKFFAMVNIITARPKLVLALVARVTHVFVALVVVTHLALVALVTILVLVGILPLTSVVLVATIINHPDLIVVI